MKRISFSLLFALVIYAFSAKNRSSHQAAFDAGAVDRFITRQIAVQRIPGLALAVTRGDQVLYVKGYGNAGSGQPVSAQTQFYIASVSKSFTAMAVMQQVEAGKIDLDTPVQTYLPEFTLADPTAASRITVRHLLNMTSGLSENGYAELQQPQPESSAERVTSLRIARTVAPPGTEYHYFNPNYGILARVVEVVSGQSFSAYLQTHIFQPLGMQHTLNAMTFQEGNQKASSLASGHLVAFGMPIAFTERSGYIGGSGGVITTAEDMAPYLITLLNGGSYQVQQLVDPESITVMQTPPAGIDTNYAMGWVVSTHNGRPIIEHAGVYSNYSADVVLLPGEGIGIALLYNVSSLPTNAIGQPQIRDGLIALLPGGEPQPGRFSVGMWAAFTALLTLSGGFLALRSLLRLPAWAQKARTTPVWKHLPGILWTFTPALMLFWGIPAMTARFGDRVFGFINLYRAMLGIFTWLAITSVLGVINGMARIILLLRRPGQIRSQDRPELQEH
ncbi:MAG: beta-lactamase family protein [Chloroflexi bacterium]|nr:beta-lactamase family protein [Chloroflexota bacterium]